MRALFGGQPILVERNGDGIYRRPLKGYTFTAWDAETGGNQHTDLEQGGVPVTAFTTGAADRALPATCYGPPDVDALWLDSGDGTRELVRGTFTAVGLSATYVSVGQTTVNASSYADDIQAAINALPSGGGKVILDKPSYVLPAGGLSTAKPNLEIVAAGASGQDGVVGEGATLLSVPAGAWGFTFNPTAAATVFQGPKLVGLHIQAAPGDEATALGGVRLNRVNNWTLDHVVCSDFNNGTGILSDGTGNANQYGVMVNPGANNNNIGIDYRKTGGCRVFGGQIDANANSGVVRAGAIGFRRWDGGSTNSFYGTVFQYADTLISLEAGEGLSEFYGCRYEGFTTAAFNIAEDDTRVYGGSVNNFQGGSVGTGFILTATSKRVHLMPNRVIAVATNFTDAGTDNVKLINKRWSFPTGHEMQLSPGTFLTSSGNDLAVTGSNSLRLNNRLITGLNNNSYGVFLGGIQDTEWRRIAANVAGTTGGIRAGTFTTAGRPSASAYTAGAQIYDLTLQKPVWSDGTNWRDAAGTVV